MTDMWRQPQVIQSSRGGNIMTTSVRRSGLELTADGVEWMALARTRPGRGRPGGGGTIKIPLGAGVTGPEHLEDRGRRGYI